MRKGEMLNKALMLAINGHADQYDKGRRPYILHPLKVMHYLKTDDEELQCIAILHDYIEDCGKKGATYQQLRDEGMTERIIEGVRCLTKVPGATDEENELRVLSNIDAMLVKKEDLRHNTDIRRLKGVTDKDHERIRKYQKFYVRIQEELDKIENHLKLNISNATIRKE